MKFPHEEALEDYEISTNKLPKTIQGQIHFWNQENRKVYGNQEVDKAQEQALIARSAVIADMIQDFMEKDLMDEEVTPPASPDQNKNTMLSDTDKFRAKNLGLDPETATIADIEAKEKEIKDAEDAKAAAESKEKADKEAAEAADKAAADKAAADKAAADKAAQEEDEDDLLDGLM